MTSTAPFTVFIAGGTSNTGAATIQHLLKSHPNVTIRAGVRDLQKATGKFPSADSKRLTFVEHNIKDKHLKGDGKSDAAELKGVDALLLVPPQAVQDRTGVSEAYINAAKAAGVKHIVAISAPAAKDPKLVLGAGMHVIEQQLKASGIPSTFLHCLFFFENHWGNQATVKSQSAFYYPAKNDVPVGQLAVSDIGEAAANALVQGPSKHSNKTYLLSGQPQTWDQTAQTYSKVLGKPINFVSVSDDAASKAMVAMGFPETMAKGMIELHHEFDKGISSGAAADLTALLGHAPLTFEAWLTPIAAAFK